MHNRSRPGPSATHRHHGGQRDRLATTDIRITAVFGAISINPAVHHYLQGLHPRPDDPKAVALMAEQVARQAEMLAMIDVFQPITWSFIMMLPLVFFLRKKQVESGPTPVAAE